QLSAEKCRVSCVWLPAGAPLAVADPGAAVDGAPGAGSDVLAARGSGRALGLLNHHHASAASRNAAIPVSAASGSLRVSRPAPRGMRVRSGWLPWRPPA